MPPWRLLLPLYASYLSGCNGASPVNANLFPNKSLPMKLLPLLLIALGLTNCASHSPTVVNSMQLYSPDVLELPAAMPLHTLQGIYIPQGPERWYSADLYMKRVREALTP